MLEKVKKIACNDIYEEEIEKSLKSLRRFREAWLRSPSGWNTEFLQYADPDFYFYRFAIERQEKGTESFLLRILYRIMERYEIDFYVPEDIGQAPFSFILINNGIRIGYTFKDFYSEDDVKSIFSGCNIDKAFIIRTWKHGRADEWIKRNNNQNYEDDIMLREILLEDFFRECFGDDEWNVFQTFAERYLIDAKDIIGYKSIKVLSSMNLASQKAYEEKLIAEWDYRNYKYQIIDENNKEISKYLYLVGDVITEKDMDTIVENYIKQKIYKTMVGGNEYAESFVTSEWLYHSLEGKKNFDFTSVISGYLKSIEQLLNTIVMINVNNNCKIAMSRTERVLSEANKKRVVKYIKGDNGWTELSKSGHDGRQVKGRRYIDLVTSQFRYMDSSIGTFEYFLRNNVHIFNTPALAPIIADMVSCFRIECRNGYLHTHNLKDWNIVKKTRCNALFLYFLLLGGCFIPENKHHELKITSNDVYDELCKKIREFRHFSLEFIFEYDDGKDLNMIYDFYNNAIEYNEDGVEHYISLLFYEVEEFTLEAMEKLNYGIKKSFFLTRDNLPKRIYGIRRDGMKEKIFENGDMV